MAKKYQISPKKSSAHRHKASPRRKHKTSPLVKALVISPLVIAGGYAAYKAYTKYATKTSLLPKGNVGTLQGVGGMVTSFVKGMLSPRSSEPKEIDNDKKKKIEEVVDHLSDDEVNKLNNTIHNPKVTSTIIPKNKYTTLEQFALLSDAEIENLTQADFKYIIGMVDDKINNLNAIYKEGKVKYEQLLELTKKKQTYDSRPSTPYITTTTIEVLDEKSNTLSQPKSTSTELVEPVYPVINEYLSKVAYLINSVRTDASNGVLYTDKSLYRGMYETINSVEGLMKQANKILEYEIDLLSKPMDTTNHASGKRLTSIAPVNMALIAPASNPLP
jgi:hypothetical protein